MISTLVGISWIVVIAGSGYTLLALIGGRRAYDLPFLAGLSLALGCCGAGLLLFWLSLLGLPPSRVVLLALFAVCVAVVVLRRKKLPYGRFRFPSQNREKVLTGLVTVAALAAVAVAVVYAMSFANIEWDAYMLWGYKARVVFTEPVRQADYFHDPSYATLHLNYPLLIPFLMASINGVAGGIEEILPKLVFPVVYVAWGCLVYAGVRRQIAGSTAAVVAVLAFICAAMVRHSGSGYADVALSAFIAGSLIWLLRWSRSASRRDALLAAIFAAAAGFTKNEGLAYLALVAVFSGVLVCRQDWRRRLSGWGVFVGAALLLILPWLLFRRTLPRLDEDYLSHLTLATLQSNADRFPDVILGMLREVFLTTRWNGVGHLLVVLAVFNWRSFRDRTVQFLWIVLLAQAGLYAVIYIVGPADPTQLMTGTLERLVIHLLPAATLLVGAHWRWLRAATYLHRRAVR